MNYCIDFGNMWQRSAILCVKPLYEDDLKLDPNVISGEVVPKFMDGSAF